MVKNKDLNKLEEKNFKTICRLCLMDGCPFHEICGTRIRSMVQYCLNIKISLQDQLPSHICAKCFLQLMNFNTFKTKTEENDMVLKKAIKDWSVTKDIINIALEQSDINTSESNGRQNGVKIINNNSVRTDEKLKQSENNIVNLYESKHCGNILDFSAEPNLNLGSVQGQQNTFCLTYNIEPPPLVPLHSNDRNRNIKNIVKHSDSSVPTTLLNTTILEPPPLVPIEIVEEKNLYSNNLSCNRCTEKFRSLMDLKEHVKSNCILNYHKCNICKKSFADRKKLVFHLNGHKNSKNYLCNICGKKYSSRSTFIVHIRSHTGERPFSCTICGRGFVRWEGVKNHMKTHEDFRPYKCETCGKEFKIISNLYRHQRLHSGNYTFSCHFCGKTFSQSEHLKLHIRTYHTHEKPYLCCECGKGFVSAQRLKRHEQVHSEHKPYPCALCCKAYTHESDLKNHSLRVHNKNENKDELKKYACSKCDLKFRHLCRLTRHMRIHVKNCSFNSLKDESALAR